LAEAEQMLQRTLQSYEKALDVDNAMKYIPALNTISSLSSLFVCKSDLVKARVMYSRVLEGYGRVVGLDDPRSQILRDSLQFLDTVTENNPLRDVDEPPYNSQGETSGLGAEGKTSKTKRYKIFEKLRFR
jgi:hypothetical protein